MKILIVIGIILGIIVGIILLFFLGILLLYKYLCLRLKRAIRKYAILYGAYTFNDLKSYLEKDNIQWFDDAEIGAILSEEISNQNITVRTMYNNIPFSEKLYCNNYSKGAHFDIWHLRYLKALKDTIISLLVEYGAFTYIELKGYLANTEWLYLDDNEIKQILSEIDSENNLFVKKIGSSEKLYCNNTGKGNSLKRFVIE